MNTRRLSRGSRIGLATTTTAAVLAVATAGCGGPGADGRTDRARNARPTVELPDLEGERIQVAAVWTGAEQENFQRVLDEFEERTGAEVAFQPTGDNVSTFLGSKIEGGRPPDVAFLPQVGVFRQFAAKGWLKQLGSEASAQLRKNHSRGWQELGTHEGKRYGVYYKVANKSLIWYNAAVFRDAGVSEPKTWDEFVETAWTVSDYGVPPVSIGGADGWTLTDWFENVYLSQAGAEKYDRLAQHEIKWTDPSVTEALTTLAGLFGERHLVAGGPSGALQTEFPDSVSRTFSGRPEAAMVFEGDFVAVEIATSTPAELGKDAKVFPFPAVGDRPPLVSAGDIAVALKDGRGAQALLTFLASTDAAAISASGGGFLSPNRGLDLAWYPDAVSRDIAKAVVEAGDDFRFDMSDQAPAAFGGTKGAGEWRRLQEFLRDTGDIAGTQRRLEADAAKAYGKEG